MSQDTENPATPEDEPNPEAAFDAALAMVADGHRVFPLRVGTKKPQITDWPHRASSDPEQIRRWHHQYPNANWAVVCGDGLSVLDIDGEVGEASFSALGWGPEA